MQFSRFNIALLLASFLAAPAFADDLVIATGDSKSGSAYSRTWRELVKVCPSAEYKERETLKGSTENIDLLTDNQVQGALLQGDFLAYWNKRSPDRVANVRVLFPLWNEELHYVARADVKKEGGFMGIGGKEVSYDTILDLKGRKIGAVGGSAVSGRVVSDSAGVGYSVVDYDDNTKLVEALKAKQIDAILITGGAQHKLVQGLDGNFKLLSVPAEVQAKLAKIYKSVDLNYANVNAVGVKSLATPAYVTVWNYTDADRVKQLLALRECFQREAPKLSSRSGTFAKWRQVNVNDKGNWAYYDGK